MQFPKLDTVMLDNWLRGCLIEVDGRKVVFPDGKDYFVRMLCGARIAVEQRAVLTASEKPNA